MRSFMQQETFVYLCVRSQYQHSILVQDRTCSAFTAFMEVTF